MDELIKRLEAATGPDRELDACIFCALLHPDKKPERNLFYTNREEWGVFVTNQPAPGMTFYDAPIYTASLDAAMTLVPEGARVREVGQWDDNGKPSGWFACVMKWERHIGGWRYVSYMHGILDEDKIPDLAPNGAIALCIAALRARMAGDRSEG